MSQYGARGYARAGWGYQRILAHYYRGTELRIVPARPVRVLLAEHVPAVQISSTKPFKVVDARGKARRLKSRHAEPRRRRSCNALRLPLRYVAGAAPLQLDGTAYRGALVVHRQAGKLTIVNRLPARPLPPRRRALGDARRLAPRGASRPVGRRPLIRTRDAQAGLPVRPLRRHAQPGLRRHSRGGGLDEPCDRFDGGPRSLLERARRDDLLPLDLGREDRLERGGVAGGDASAVSRLGLRSVRRSLEAPPLGPVPVDAGRRGAEARRWESCATSSSPADHRDARRR